MPNDKKLTRDIIIQYITQKYATPPEHLWKKFPNYIVFRKQSNHKWYAIIMDVPKSKLGFNDDTVVNILDIKCPPDLIGSFIDNKAYFPAYHMNKEHWISILLEELSSSDNNIFNLIDLSYELV